MEDVGATWLVSVVDETGSTNADLLAAAAAGAPDRSVLAARHQTAGRGRLDRRWDAPAGTNLLVSILFRQVPGNPQVLTQRVALAAAVAVERTTGVRALLKWPNDLQVVVDGQARKLAGVLAQAGAVSGRVDHVVVGIGINVGWAPDDAAHLDGAIAPLDLLDALLVEIDRLPADADELHREYRVRLGTLGQRVRVQRGDGDLLGRAVDVDADGRLVVVDDADVTHRIDTGDVVHLRPVT